MSTLDSITFAYSGWFCYKYGIDFWPAISHVIMMSSVVLTGITLVLSTIPSCPLPKDTHNFAIALSAGIVAFLMAGHGSASRIRDHMHLLLACIVFAMAILSLVDIYCRGSVVMSLLRPMVSLLLGTWLIQLAFVLFHPGYQPLFSFDDDVDGLGYITLVFVWHMLAIVIFVLVTLVVACLRA